MALDPRMVARFHGVLVEEILRTRPEYLTTPFTVAEIYQALVPYRTHRDRIGVELNGDYEEALLHLLAGEAEYLVLDSPAARDHIRRELRSRNPNTGVFREFAALTVRLNPRHMDPAAARAPGPGDEPLSEADAPASPEVAPPPEQEPDQADVFLPRSEPAAPSGETASTEGSSMSENVSGAAASADAPPHDCPDCHRSLPERAGLRFCPFCGVDVFVTSCSACGEELDRDWSFCIVCGTPTGLEAGRAGG
jgi:hypothetical protein